MGFLRRAIEHLPMRDARAPGDRKRWRGALLVGAGLLVYVGGLIPEIRWERQRAEMGTTMLAMREIGNQLAEHHRRTGHLPDSIAELGGAHPRVDGFGNPLRYARDASSDRWTIVSAGADGREQGYQQELTAYLDCDIIYAGVGGDSSGQFTQCPEGIPMGTILGPGWSYRWFRPLKVMYGAR